MVDPTVVRDVDADHNRDLLVEPPRTCMAFLDADGPQLTPVDYVGDEHAAVVTPARTRPCQASAMTWRC